MRGKVHVWIGIVVGGFFAILWIILTIVVMVKGIGR